MYDTYQEGQLTYVGVTKESAPRQGEIRESFGKELIFKNGY